MLVPVIANTVQRSVISPYHLSVPRGGISFGPSHRCKNVVGFLSVLVLVLCSFGDDVVFFPLVDLELDDSNLL